jgi:uncharacterized protein YbbC (DUF1343 family)
MKKILFLVPFLVIAFLTGCSQPSTVQHPIVDDSKIIPAAERLDDYLPLLKNKRVAVFANNTSMVHDVHLVDTLSRSGVEIKKIFAPEHGFRGTADAGEKRYPTRKIRQRAYLLFRFMARKESQTPKTLPTWT